MENRNLNKLGRPKIDDLEKRKYKLNLYLNKEEIEKLKSFGLDNSEKIRIYLFRTFIEKNIVLSSEKDVRYIHELNKIGINLNQITKILNASYNILPKNSDKLELILNQLQQKLS